MLTRRDEDKAACKILGAVSRPCGFLDLQYRDGEEPDCDKIIEMICGLLHPDIHLFAPLGLDHPDHRLVSQCVRLACPPEILFYEELPARVLHPEQVVEALDEIDAEGWTIDALPVPLPSGDRRLKEHALRCYRSQFGDDLDPAFLVPERVWRATK
jgi:LmbE family N-acetylglucosaminyl deacetylase